MSGRPSLSTDEREAASSRPRPTASLLILSSPLLARFYFFLPMLCRRGYWPG